MATVEHAFMMCTDPQAVERAQRLQYAVMLLRREINESDVRRRLREYYKVSQPTAWRVVEVAKDFV